MALSIQSSNRVETLQQNLSQHLTASPLSNPFAAEIIVVPTFAMGRWLNLRFAQQQGIAANIQYPLPAGWLWNTAASLIDGIPDLDPLRQESLLWKIYSALPGLLVDPAFKPLSDYLTQDDNGVKRWQLSVKIAQLFDQYQQYRPQMIRDWSSKSGDNWQALLWQKLLADVPENHHVAILSQLVSELRQGKRFTSLPQRISLFAISSLPPLYIEVIHALAGHSEITLYQHNPTDQYWADLKNRKSLTRMQLSEPQNAEYYETGNELLVSWGRQSQAMQDSLLDYGSLASSDSEFNFPPGNSSLLHSIQQSIFSIESSPENLRPDESLSVHICHSPLRECQVLHDHILYLLDNNPDLSSEDILVMVPEIGLYAPYIEAVFTHDESAGRPYLPWNLSDISIVDEHPLIQTFLQLLKLPDSRYAYSEISSLLEVAEIRQRFDIDEQGLREIRDLLDTSNVRWGIDGSHKASLGLPAIEENTWHQASDRIFAGYAFGDIAYWNGIAPLAQVDADRAVTAGRFWNLFERLTYWRQILGQTTTSVEWQTHLNALVDDLFVSIDFRDDRLQQIRDCIDQLSLAENSLISPQLLRHWFDQQLSVQSRQGRLFSGGVTFCGMRPMRNLPFPVICLMGMGDNAFPRRESRNDFDLMAQNRKPGDPHKGDEDRYLMLETLLCARQSLYISYSGRSLKDNSACQPSVLVQELLDFLDFKFESDPVNHVKVSEQLITVHPMQAFAATNYLNFPGSYDNYWCDVANHLQTPGAIATETKWPLHSGISSDYNIEGIDLGQLHRFFRHPVKYFFNSQFKIYLGEDRSNNDEESFMLDGLESWEIKTRLADDLVRGEASQRELLRAEGRLPHGSTADIELQNIYRQSQPWLDQLKLYSHLGSESIVIRCLLESGQVFFGEVPGYYSGTGLMHYTASKFKSVNLFGLWLDHLALCAGNLFAAGETSKLISLDAIVELKPLDSASAITRLNDYTKIFEQGQLSILPVFPTTSYEFADQGKFEKAWQGDERYGGGGDSQDDYVKLALRNTNSNPLLDPAFRDYAQRIYSPLITALADS
ncbi:MAG: exodeoxyribonuclease V subunit gamma [Gammaproteobacteria bacterium]|nr:exodeoxyribonuclease V subunit gamma [Gammaproteobacteria bacterium]